MSQALPQDDAPALQATLASLRRAGAWRADPARFRWLEALARRLPGQAPAVRSLLQAKLERAIAEFAAQPAPALPPANGLPTGRRAGAAPAAGSAPLAALNHYIRGVTPGAAATPGHEQPHPELASVRRFRRAWSARRSQQQVAQAALRKPANAGPLNSHALVLDSLELMRELSPDYLRRFLLHVESLQWLDQARGQAAPAGKAKPAKAVRRGRGGQ